MAEGGQRAAQNPGSKKERKVAITKKTIQSHWGFLKNSIILCHISDSLIENDVLTPDQYKDIEVKDLSESRRMEAFLYILFKKSNFDSFCKSLINSGYSHIVDTLEGRAAVPQEYRTMDRAAVGEVGTLQSSWIDEKRRNTDEIIQKMEGMFDKMNQRFDQHEEDHQLQIKNHQLQIEMLSEKNSSLENHIKEINQFLSEAKENLKTGTFLKEEIEMKLQSKSQECQQLQRDNDWLKQQLNTAMDDSEQVVELKKELKRMTSQIENLKNKNARLAKEKGDNLKEMRHINEQLLAAEKSKRQIIQNLQERDEEMRILLQKCEKKDKQISELSKAIEKLKDENKRTVPLRNFEMRLKNNKQ